MAVTTGTPAGPGHADAGADVAHDGSAHCGRVRAMARMVSRMGS